MIVTFRDPALFVGNLKACLLAASPDEARPTSCIRLECGGASSRFIATDGHWMWINEIRSEAESTDGAGRVVLLSIEDAKRIVKLVEVSKKAAAWAVEIDTDGRTVRQLSQSLAYGPVDKVFPPYNQVLPATVGGERIIACFDAHLMARVAAAFAHACCVKTTVPLMFHTTAPGKFGPEPIVITGCKHAAVADALAVLMPCNYDVGGPGALLARYRGERLAA